MSVLKLVGLPVALVLVLIASTIQIKPVEAGASKPVALVYGPDVHGVVCYQQDRNSWADPLSCVKVY